MIHNIKFLSFFLTVCLFIQSCTKESILSEKIAEAEFLFNVRDVSDKAGRVLITSSNNLRSDNLIDGITITGRFKDSEGTIHESKLFNVNSLDVPFNAKGRIEHTLFLPHQVKKEEFERFSSEWLQGQIEIDIDNNQVGRINRSIVPPSPIQPISTLPKSLDKTESFIIRWLPNNKVQKNTEYVGLMLIYRPGHSIPNNPDANLPNETITVYKYAEDGEGEITVTPEELSVFPDHGEVYTYLARGQQETITTTGPNGQIQHTVISLVSYTYTEGIEVKIN